MFFFVCSCSGGQGGAGEGGLVYRHFSQLFFYVCRVRSAGGFGFFFLVSRISHLVSRLSFVPSGHTIIYPSFRPSLLTLSCATRACGRAPVHDLLVFSLLGTHRLHGRVGLYRQRLGLLRLRGRQPPQEGSDLLLGPPGGRPAQRGQAEPLPTTSRACE